MVRLHSKSSRPYSGRSVLPSTPATEGAAVREDRREGTEVSRGHSTGRHEPGNTPDGLTTREGLNLAGSTTIAGRRLAMKPNGGAGPRASVAEKECCLIRVVGVSLGRTRDYLGQPHFGDCLRFF